MQFKNEQKTQDNLIAGYFKGVEKNTRRKGITFLKV